MKPTMLISVISVVVVGVVVVLGGCTDPYRDRQIAELGPEQEGVAQGAEHRPGQPCVLCHSEGGPASDHPFAIGGTIYETPSPNSRGAAGVTVELVDSNGSAPDFKPVTNSAGNFFVRKDEWKDMAFALKVRILPTDKTSRPIEMTTTINRDGSCNTCHLPFNGGAELDPMEKDRLRGSIGQIFVGAGAAR